MQYNKWCWRSRPLARRDVRNGAVLRELLFSRTKRLLNTRIAGAILTCYEMNNEFIYMRYDVDLYHVVLETLQNYIRMCVRMT
jgi:hypothetical protein